MKSIYQKAQEYSSNKSGLALSKAIAQAYLDGYRDGYDARKNKEEAGFIGDDLEYVDLGLPSGTLWAKDSLKDDDERCFLTFDEANMLNIPSAEQWEELQTHCKWILIDNLHASVTAKCIGPNGQYILFSLFESFIKPNGWKDSHSEGGGFWLKSVFDSTDGKGPAASFYKLKGDDKLTFRQASSDTGYKYPVRLIKDAL